MGGSSSNLLWNWWLHRFVSGDYHILQRQGLAWFFFVLGCSLRIYLLTFLLSVGPSWLITWYIVPWEHLLQRVIKKIKPQKKTTNKQTIPLVNRASTLNLVCHSSKYLGFLLISWVNTSYSLVAMLLQRNATNNG